MRKKKQIFGRRASLIIRRQAEGVQHTVWAKTPSRDQLSKANWRKANNRPGGDGTNSRRPGKSDLTISGRRGSGGKANQVDPDGDQQKWGRLLVSFQREIGKNSAARDAEGHIKKENSRPAPGRL